MLFPAIVAVPLVAIGGLIWPTWKGAWLLMDWFDSRRERRRARVERELDRQQAELRSTILKLASSLGADAHEARKALIRESFLASGKIHSDQ